MSVPMSTQIVRLVKNSDGLPCIFSCDKKYIVPEYQRAYCWGDDQISDFANSVRRALAGEDVFMGTIQFSIDSKRKLDVSIIDGQQRMTTFLLLFHLIDQELKTTLLKDYGISLDIHNFASNTQKLKDALKGVSDTSYSENVYAKNLNLICTELSDILGNNITTKQLQNAVMNNIYFVELTTTDMPLPQVVGVFNTINTTGLDLDAGDMFKLQYYEYLKRNYHQNDNWMSEISKCYERVNSSGTDKQEYLSINDILDIYKHCIVAKYDLKWEMLSASNESFFEEVLSTNFSNNNLAKDKMSILTFEYFSHLVDIVIDFQNQLYTENSSLLKLASTTELLALDLIILTRYRRYWTVPYVDAFFRCHKTDSSKTRAEKLQKSLQNGVAVSKYFAVCSVTYDKVINPVQTYMCNIILPQIAKGALVANTVSQVIEKSPYHPDDTQNLNRQSFNERISNNLFENGARSFIVCTLSALLEEIKAGATTEKICDKLFDWQSSPYDLEHILARNIFEKTDKKNSPTYNSIGNLVVLERDINRGIKDKPCKEKVLDYKRSKYRSVKLVENTIASNNGIWGLTQVEGRLSTQKKSINKYLFG